jgi:hypothetical protein
VSGRDNFFVYGFYEVSCCCSWLLLLPSFFTTDRILHYGLWCYLFCCHIIILRRLRSGFPLGCLLKTHFTCKANSYLYMTNMHWILHLRNSLTCHLTIHMYCVSIYITVLTPGFRRHIFW